MSEYFDQPEYISNTGQMSYTGPFEFAPYGTRGAGPPNPPPAMVTSHGYPGRRRAHAGLDSGLRVRLRLGRSHGGTTSTEIIARRAAEVRVAESLRIEYWSNNAGQIRGSKKRNRQQSKLEFKYATEVQPCGGGVNFDGG